MSRTATEIGMIAGGIGIALAAGPLGLEVFHSLVVMNYMIGVGLTTAMMGTAGLLNPLPLDPSNIGPQGQLPVQTPNPLWRVVYGIFQFAGAITFEDGPLLGWQGTPAGKPCGNQYMHRVYTLTSHQIAGFLAVVLDGQTFNFGTDIVLLTPANSPQGKFGPVGMWGFLSNANPWLGQILFAFDCGDPGYGTNPFEYLTTGATVTFSYGPHYTQLLGSTRWPVTCLQRGRSKVHVITHYAPANDQVTWGPSGGAPQPYVLSGGRLPTIEFKIAGRIVLDYRVVTAWQPLTSYNQNSYVLAVGANGQVCVFVQMTGSSGISAATIPNFQTVAFGGTIAESSGSCAWLNAGVPIYAAGSGQTALNNSFSNKLGGPGRTVLIADSWQGNQRTDWQGTPAVIEAPIGWLQMPSSAFLTGQNRPDFDTSSPPKVGKVTTDALGSWICLGRSKNATVLPDDDGTENQGGFSNSALCIADYLTTARNEFGLGAVLTKDSIDSIVAAANICDEKVTIAVY